MLKDVVLFSGGMDSLIAWEYLKRPDRLYVRMNHRYQNEELSRIEGMKLPGNLLIVDLLELGRYEKSDAEIPLRNLYLAMICVNRGYSNIWLVVQKDEMGAPDRTMSFMDKISSLLSVLSGRVIQVRTPFEFMDKSDMVSWYVSEGLNLELLRSTWACYFPIGGEPCGNCGACLRRYVAFRENGLNPGYELSVEIKSMYKGNFERYSPTRQERMSRWL